jgi:hypothetical protein
MLTGENQRTQRKACPSATLSTTNPTRTDRGAKPVLCGEMPATNRLSHGTADIIVTQKLFDLTNVCSDLSSTLDLTNVQS